MHADRIIEKVQARAKDLRERADLVPEGLRDWWLNYLDAHLERYVSIISCLPPPESCGRLLEIGCVPGHLTILMADMGYELCCVDVEPERFAELWQAHSMEVHKVNIETEPLPFNDHSFSMVLFAEVLEHLRVQPIFALKETARVTKAGGRLILTVPNITPIARLKFLFGLDYQGDIIAEFEKLEKLGHMGHIRLYSKKEVERILRYVGYTGIEYAREGRIKGVKVWLPPFPGLDYFRSRLCFVAWREDETSKDDGLEKRKLP